MGFQRQGFSINQQLGGRRAISIGRVWRWGGRGAALRGRREPDIRTAPRMDRGGLFSTAAVRARESSLDQNIPGGRKQETGQVPGDHARWPTDDPASPCTYFGGRRKALYISRQVPCISPRLRTMGGNLSLSLCDILFNWVSFVASSRRAVCQWRMGAIICGL